MIFEAIAEAICQSLVHILGERLCTWWGVALFFIIMAGAIGGYIWYKMTGGQV